MSMTETRAIYVQGCARSGNTLMRELCATGFRGAKLVKISKTAAECSLDHLVSLLTAPVKHSAFSTLLAPFLSKRSRPPALLVASRDRDNSYDMAVELLRAHPEIKVIWMLRNPLDVLTSTHPDQPGKFYMPPLKVLKALELYQRFRHEPQVLSVHYEELVSNPGAVHARIASAFQVEPLRDFTEGYKHFPRFDQNVRAMHSIRPIDAGSVQKWKSNPGYREYLQQTLAEHPILISAARACGYEISLT